MLFVLKVMFIQIIAWLHMSSFFFVSSPFPFSLSLSWICDLITISEWVFTYVICSAEVYESTLICAQIICFDTLLSTFMDLKWYRYNLKSDRFVSSLICIVLMVWICEAVWCAYCSLQIKKSNSSVWHDWSVLSNEYWEGCFVHCRHDLSFIPDVLHVHWLHLMTLLK